MLKYEQTNLREKKISVDLYKKKLAQTLFTVYTHVLVYLMYKSNCILVGNILPDYDYYKTR